MAQRLDVWPRRYRFVFDDSVAALVTPSIVWRGGASFDLGRRRYFVDDFGKRLEMRIVQGKGEGTAVAEAKSTGRTRWALSADKFAYELRRRGLRGEQHLYAGAEHVGRVRRQGKDAAADLPSLEKALQAFVMIVALKRWDRFVTEAVGLNSTQPRGRWAPGCTSGHGR